MTTKVDNIDIHLDDRGELVVATITLISESFTDVIAFELSEDARYDIQRWLSRVTESEVILGEETSSALVESSGL